MRSYRNGVLGCEFSVRLRRFITWRPLDEGPERIQSRVLSRESSGVECRETGVQARGLGT